MSELALPIYVVDTNSLVDWQDRYYPQDIFPSLLQFFDGLVDANRLISSEIAYEEVQAVGGNLLRDWAKARKSAFHPAATHLAGALQIEGQFPGLKDPKSQYTEADAYIIALAQASQGIVVTQETPASQKHKPRRTHFIPDVCSDLGIPCINILGLMRREGLSL